MLGLDEAPNGMPANKGTLSVQAWAKQGASYEVSLSRNLWGAVHRGKPSSTLFFPHLNQWSKSHLGQTGDLY